MNKKATKRGLLFGAGTAGVLLAAASTAFACVTFMGTMQVHGEKGSTKVTGAGNAHGYCANGAPLTAAAGSVGSVARVVVTPGDVCPVTTNHATGQQVANVLPDGQYEVRLNNASVYSGADGTGWTMTPGTGCFRKGNEATTASLGFLDVVNGVAVKDVSISNGTNILGGSISGTINGPNDASNFCIGAVSVTTNTTGTSTKPGMLSPFRVTL